MGEIVHLPEPPQTINCECGCIIWIPRTDGTGLCVGCGDVSTLFEIAGRVEFVPE